MGQENTYISELWKSSEIANLGCSAGIYLVPTLSAAHMEHCFIHSQTLHHLGRNCITRCLGILRRGQLCDQRQDLSLSLYFSDTSWQWRNGKTWDSQIPISALMNRNYSAYFLPSFILSAALPIIPHHYHLVLETFHFVLSKLVIRELMSTWIIEKGDMLHPSCTSCYSVGFPPLLGCICDAVKIDQQSSMQHCEQGLLLIKLCGLFTKLVTKLLLNTFEVLHSLQLQMLQQNSSIKAFS